MKKIIAVTALAVAFLAWRMGAMEQVGQAVTLVTKDGQSTAIAKNKAELFGTLHDLMSDLSEDDQNKQNLEIPIKGIAKKADLEALLKDLDWVEQVRRQKEANESEQQVARRIVSAMPRVDFNRQMLSQLVKAFGGAVYLGQMTLLELYARQITDMIMSDVSMRLLSQGDQEYSDLITKLDCNLVILQYMPGAWVEYWYTIKHDQSVTSVAISAEGNRAVMGSWNKDVMIVSRDEAGIWQNRQEATKFSHTGGITSVAISGDGNTVVTGCSDNSAKILVRDKDGAWQERYSCQPAQSPSEENVVSVAISAGGNAVVIGSFDGNSAKIIERDAAGSWHLRHTIPHAGAVQAVAISAGGNKVVTGARDMKVKIQEKNVAGTWHERGDITHGDFIHAVAISANGDRVVTGCLDKHVRILEPNAGGWQERYRYKYAGFVVSVAISVDGNRVAVGSVGEAKILENTPGGWKDCYSLPNSYRSVAISAEGDRVVTESEDRFAKIIERDAAGKWRERERCRIKCGDRVNSVAISANGNEVVAGSSDHNAKILHIEVLRYLPGLSDFDGLLLIQLLYWAYTNKRKITNAWVGKVLGDISWKDVKPHEQRKIQEWIRDVMPRSLFSTASCSLQ